MIEIDAILTRPWLVTVERKGGKGPRPYTSFDHKADAEQCAAERNDLNDSCIYSVVENNHG